MQIGILRELPETRVALVPDTIAQLIKTGCQVWVERSAGDASFFNDDAMEAAGARCANRADVLQAADLLICINPPEAEVLKAMQGKAIVSSFQPFAEPKVKDELAGYKLTAFSLDMIPRSTLAQSMDILSSMASIAGYKAVLAAASKLPRYFPMLTTAAGTIPPTKLLVLGAGVAGLQAIATAKRLGAVVEAFDTRLAAKEEVESLGAKFVMVEGAKDDKAAGGYAVEQSEEYKQKQRELLATKIEKADVVITTAQLRGKRAPTLITQAMVETMKPGSVIVDLAASSGGNCELTKNNETIVHGQIYIIGNSAFAADMPQNASQLYSKNVFNFLKLLIGKEGQLMLESDHEILQSSCIVLKGEIR